MRLLKWQPIPLAICHLSRIGCYLPPDTGKRALPYTPFTRRNWLDELAGCLLNRVNGVITPGSQTGNRFA